MRMDPNLRPSTANAVFDQLSYRDRRQTMLRGEPKDFWSTRHGAIVIDKLAQHPARRATREPRQIVRGLLMTEP